jgi:hypothetical protein
MSSKYLAQANEYYHNNKDKVKEYQAKNKEKIKEYQRKYFQNTFKNSPKYCNSKKKPPKVKTNKKKPLLPTYKLKMIESVLKVKYKEFLRSEEIIKVVNSYNSRTIQRELHCLPQPKPFSGFIPTKTGFVLTW